MRTIFVMSFNKNDDATSYTVQERPHITFLSHLTVPDDADLQPFLNRLELLTKQMKPFHVTAGKEISLGEDGTHSAIEILDNNHAASRLHFVMLDNAERFAYELQQPQYAGSNFLPHITQSSRLPLSHEAGEQVLVDSLTVSEHRGEVLFEDVRDLVTYPLTGVNQLDWK
jgi:hypothetical protein